MNEKEIEVQILKPNYYQNLLATYLKNEKNPLKIDATFSFDIKQNLMIDLTIDQRLKLSITYQANTYHDWDFATNLLLKIDRYHQGAKMLKQISQIQNLDWKATYLNDTEQFLITFYQISAPEKNQAHLISEANFGNLSWNEQGVATWDHFPDWIKRAIGVDHYLDEQFRYDLII